MAFLLLGLRLLTMAFRLLLDMRLLTMAFRLLLDVRLLTMAFRLLLDVRLLTMAFRLRGLGWVTMRLRLGFQPLDSPSLLVFPIIGAFPRVPVLFDLFVGHAFVVPGLTSPLVLAVFMSPILRHLSIKRWDAGIVVPTPIIIPGTVPVPLPWTPPPAVEEKDVLVNVWDNIDISLRQDDHLWWRGEYNGGRQWNPDLDVHLRIGRTRQNA
jgi:hypothetical protein